MTKRRREPIPDRHGPRRTLTRREIEAALPGQHTLTGDIRLHEGFPSRALGRERDVLVYLPPGYEADASARFPVLYFNDGQNLFDGATSYVPGQEWQLDETAERLIGDGLLPPLIIVAIYHGGPHRLDEFTPTRDRRRRAGGDAHLFASMLIDELKPFVDGLYRTRPGPADTGVGGSSMGGLVSLHLALTRPDVFGRLAAMSPSVWWGRRAVVQRVRGLDGPQPVRIWLDIGGAEGKGAIDDVRDLREALLAKGWRQGVDLAYREEPGAGHSEAAWAARVAPMLRFLFG
jgi:predicted alpha/beta superfamily hydrolase